MATWLALFDSTLKNRLVALEKQRIKVLRLGMGIAFFAVTGALIFFSSSSLEKLNENLFMPLLILAIIGFICFLIFYSIKFNAYKKEYKSKIVAEIVKAINPEWQYNPSGFINKKEYYKSDLFRKKVDRYSGDDLIHGSIEQTDFRCSELHTEYKIQTNKNTTWHTIFRGLFFHADFNKHFFGKTYVLPDTAEKIFGNFGQKIQALTGRADLVKMENPEFEALFVVYGTDQTEARYILTPAMMEAIISLKKTLQKSIHLSFIDNRVYCAIGFDKNLFEPTVWKSGVNKENIKFIYELFMINAKIIHELNLNTRIWTKH